VTKATRSPWAEHSHVQVNPKPVSELIVEPSEGPGQMCARYAQGRHVFFFLLSSGSDKGCILVPGNDDAVSLAGTARSDLNGRRGVVVKDLGSRNAHRGTSGGGPR